MKTLKNKNINITEFSDFYENITLFNTNHTPRNLTGYIVIGQMKREYDSTFGIQLNCTITNAALGKIQISLSSNVTSNFESNSSNNNNAYVYDIVLKETSTNRVEKIQQGIAYIIPGVTNLLNPTTEITVDPTPDLYPLTDFIDGGAF